MCLLMSINPRHVAASMSHCCWFARLSTGLHIIEKFEMANGLWSRCVQKPFRNDHMRYIRKGIFFSHSILCTHSITANSNQSSLDQMREAIQVGLVTSSSRNFVKHRRWFSRRRSRNSCPNNSETKFSAKSTKYKSTKIQQYKNTKTQKMQKMQKRKKLKKYKSKK